MSISFISKNRSALKWIGIALLIKSIFFLWYAIEFNHSHWAEKNAVVGGVFVQAHDWGDYMGPIANLVDKGYLAGETIKSKGDNGILWAHRMPGFLPICGPLYFLFGYKATCIILAILQLVTDAIACYLLAMVALFLFGNMIAFRLTFIMYLISSFVSVYTHYGSSEALCTFFVIASVYYFIRFLREEKRAFIFWSGFFICWALFLRPAIAIIFFLLPIIYLLYVKRNKAFNFKSTISALAIFASVLIVVETIWISRNFKVLGRFVPLEISQENFGTPQYRAWIRFTAQMGCEQFNLDNTNALRWFNPELANDPMVANGLPFNVNNFTTEFNLDSLKALRQLNTNAWNENLPPEERKLYGELFMEKIGNYSNSLKKEHPFRFYFLNRVILLKKFLFVNQTYALPFYENSFYQKAARGFNWILNTVMIGLGLIGIILVWLSKNYLAKWISLIVLCHVFVHACILGFVEHRYLVTVFPFLVVFASFSLYQFYKKIIPERELAV